jgi:hypothetical protein
LGQVNNFASTGLTEARQTTIIGSIISNKFNSMFKDFIVNSPQNNAFTVTKTNNTNEYILVLTFEKVDEI